MTAEAERVVIELVSHAQRSTDEQLLIRIGDTVDDEHRNLVHAVVLIIVSMIDHGGAETWGGIMGRLAFDVDA